jgi:hypothetical protein
MNNPRETPQKLNNNEFHEHSIKNRKVRGKRLGQSGDEENKSKERIVKSDEENNKGMAVNGDEIQASDNPSGATFSSPVEGYTPEKMQSIINILNSSPVSNPNVESDKSHIIKWFYPISHNDLSRYSLSALFESGDKLLVPYQLDNQKWVGIVFEKTDDAKFDMKILDSKGLSKDDKKKQEDELKKLFQDQLSAQGSSLEITVVDHSVEVLKGKHPQAWMLENLYNEALGINLETNKSENQLLQEHEDILKAAAKSMQDQNRHPIVMPANNQGAEIATEESKENNDIYVIPTDGNSQGLGQSANIGNISPPTAMSGQNKFSPPTVYQNEIDEWEKARPYQDDKGKSCWIHKHKGNNPDRDIIERGNDNEGYSFDIPKTANGTILTLPHKDGKGHDVMHFDAEGYLVEPIPDIDWNTTKANKKWFEALPRRTKEQSKEQEIGQDGSGASIQARTGDLQQQVNAQKAQNEDIEKFNEEALAEINQRFDDLSNRMGDLEKKYQESLNENAALKKQLEGIKQAPSAVPEKGASNDVGATPAPKNLTASQMQKEVVQLNKSYKNADNKDEIAVIRSAHPEYKDTKDDDLKNKIKADLITKCLEYMPLLVENYKVKLEESPETEFNGKKSRTPNDEATNVAQSARSVFQLAQGLEDESIKNKISELRKSNPNELNYILPDGKFLVLKGKTNNDKTSRPKQGDFADELKARLDKDNKGLKKVDDNNKDKTSSPKQGVFDELKQRVGKDDKGLRKTDVVDKPKIVKNPLIGELEGVFAALKQKKAQSAEKQSSTQNNIVANSQVKEFTPQQILNDALREGSLDGVTKALLNVQVKVDGTGDRSHSPLTEVINSNQNFEDKEQKITLLLAKGADINFALGGDTTDTALNHAVDANDPKIIALLLKNNADPSLLGDDEVKKLFGLAAEDRDLAKELVKHSEFNDIVTKLPKNMDGTLVEKAFASDNPEFMFAVTAAKEESILGYLVDKSIKDKPNILKHCLVKGIENGTLNNSIVQQVLDQELIKIDDPITESRSTLLMVAVNYDDREMVKYLLDKGADPGIKNKKGASAISIANSGDDKNQEIIKLLEDKSSKSTPSQQVDNGGNILGALKSPVTPVNKVNSGAQNVKQ